MPKRKHVPKRMNLELYLDADIRRFLKKKGYKLTDMEISTLWEMARVGEGGKSREKLAKNIIADYGKRFLEVYARKPEATIKTLAKMKTLIEDLSAIRRFLLTQVKVLNETSLELLDIAEMSDQQIAFESGNPKASSDTVAKDRKWIAKKQKEALRILKKREALALERIKKGSHLFKCVLPGCKEQTLKIEVIGSDTDAEAVERLKEGNPDATQIKLIARREPPVSVRVRRIKPKKTMT